MGTYAFIEETTRKTEVEPSGSLGHWENHMRGTQDVGFRAVRHGYYTRYCKKSGGGYRVTALCAYGDPLHGVTAP
mgnify:CR=1 FL=1